MYPCSEFWVLIFSPPKKETNNLNNGHLYPCQRHQCSVGTDVWNKWYEVDIGIDIDADILLVIAELENITERKKKHTSGFESLLLAFDSLLLMDFVF